MDVSQLIFRICFIKLSLKKIDILDLASIIGIQIKNTDYILNPSA